MNREYIMAMYLEFHKVCGYLVCRTKDSRRFRDFCKTYSCGGMM
jgi:hypothetical protein